MGRAQGKHPRRGILEELFSASDEMATEGERREMAIGEPRDIPGGLNHLGNPPVQRQAVGEKPSQDPYTNLNAHGVEPHQAGYIERDGRLTGAVNTRVRPAYEQDHAPPSPVPVYIVERSGGPRAKAYVDTRHLTVPAASGEPVMVCPDNPARSLVQLLNEDTSHNVRIGRLQDLQYDGANAVITGGARLPAGASGYTIMRTQEALYAVSETSSTAVISAILESDLRNA